MYAYEYDRLYETSAVVTQKGDSCGRDENVESQDEDALPRTTTKDAREAKIEFLKQRWQVSKRVCESHSKLWGEVMFSRWKKQPYRPVLVLGPYQVHPDLRDTWMKMFEEVCIVYVRGFSHFPSFFMCDGIVTCLSDRCQYKHIDYRLKPTPVSCGTGATGTGLHPVKITRNREATLVRRTRMQYRESCMNFRPTCEPGLLQARFSTGRRNTP